VGGRLVPDDARAKLRKRAQAFAPKRTCQRSSARSGRDALILVNIGQ